MEQKSAQRKTTINNSDAVKFSSLLLPSSRSNMEPALYVHVNASCKPIDKARRLTPNGIMWTALFRQQLQCSQLYLVGAEKCEISKGLYYRDKGHKVLEFIVAFEGL